MTEDLKAKTKTQEAVMSVDYYLRVTALQNLLIKNGIILKEDLEKEYVELATKIVSKFKKDKQEEKK
jgi:hypothetical protein